ncbi:hypothetical protein FF124_18745 [Martelella lutilitoris]|uniref:Uncharacterized protein n=1 Tax=Martelella lutilitoris TaxID=2583532 RepID=A0A5C4JL06_9HYPH|nr:hypothetical protein [Martelella lutilitoris]TNB46195.1 hypothetical protein FF124_18745 [Martelella lutilitoris]
MKQDKPFTLMGGKGQCSGRTEQELSPRTHMNIWRLVPDFRAIASLFGQGFGIALVHNKNVPMFLRAEPFR